MPKRSSKKKSVRRDAEQPKALLEATPSTPIKAEPLSQPDNSALLFQIPDETLETWCQKIVGMDDGYGHIPNRVRLEVRQTRHEKWQRLLELPIGTLSPAEVAHKIAEEADRSGYKNCRASSWYPGAKTAFSLYTIPNEDIGLGDDIEDEVENPQGLSIAVVRQSIRHTEVLMQAMMQMQVGVMRHLGEQNRQLTESAEKLASERLELIDLVRKVKLESLDDENRAQRNTAIVDAAKTLTNAVAFRMTDGKGGDNAREELMSTMLQGLGKTITEEQDAELRKILTAEQLITLAELFRDPQGHVKKVQDEIERRDSADGEPDAS